MHDTINDLLPEILLILKRIHYSYILKHVHSIHSLEFMLIEPKCTDVFSGT